MTTHLLAGHGTVLATGAEDISTYCQKRFVRKGGFPEYWEDKPIGISADCIVAYKVAEANCVDCVAEYVRVGSKKRRNTER